MIRPRHPFAWCARYLSASVKQSRSPILDELARYGPDQAAATPRDEAEAYCARELEEARRGYWIP